ncbi:MAG: hypothetical protein RLY97_398 [Pseudomonadota bacterium]
MFKPLLLTPLVLLAFPALAMDKMGDGPMAAKAPMAAKQMSASEKRAADRCHKMTPAKAAKNATCMKMMKAMEPPMEHPMDHKM